MWCFYQRERICVPIEEAVDEMNEFERRTNASIATSLRSPPRSSERSKNVKKDSPKNIPNSNKNARSLSRSNSICNTTPKYVGPTNKSCKVSILITLLGAFKL